MIPEGGMTKDAGKVPSGHGTHVFTRGSFLIAVPQVEDVIEAPLMTHENLEELAIRLPFLLPGVTRLLPSDGLLQGRKAKRLLLELPV